jgi:hypothetical protein
VGNGQISNARIIPVHESIPSHLAFTGIMEKMYNRKSGNLSVSARNMEVQIKVLDKTDAGNINANITVAITEIVI